MNKQQLAAKIWESANKMRSKIEANEYKDYILGFIFYKFLSEKEVKYLKENDWTDEYLPDLTEEDSETVESVQKNLGYFISYDNLFSTWLSKGRDFSVQDVRDALSAFSRLINTTHKKVFEGVFDTLQTGLSKLGDSSASQSKAISDLKYFQETLMVVRHQCEKKKVQLAEINLNSAQGIRIAIVQAFARAHIYISSDEKDVSIVRKRFFAWRSR